MHKEILINLASVVKGRRAQLELSQEELAFRSGLHRTYVTDIERGKRNLTLKSILKLAIALQIPLPELFARIENKSLYKSSGQDTAGLQGSATRPVDILLIEDNQRQAEITIQALEKNGVSNAIRIMRTGEDALEYLFPRWDNRDDVNVPRVILLDLTLPRMSGLEVLRRIRDHERTREIPVVILTASRSDMDNKATMDMGATAFITKPVDFVEFSTAMPKLGFTWQLLQRFSSER